MCVCVKALQNDQENKLSFNQLLFYSLVKLKSM